MVRAQAFTLEGVVASMLVLSGLIFAYQTVAVTPLSASTSSEQFETQNLAVTTDLLQTAAEQGALRRAVLAWNASSSGFYGASGAYFAGTPPTDFGRIVAGALAPHDLVFNVHVTFENEADEQRRTRMVYRGEPTDTAVSASAAVVVYDSDRRYDAAGNPTGAELSASNFYAPDSATSSVYNVLDVEVVVWRR